MRIERDHIASSIYTIVFAYLGTALTVFLVIQIYDRSVYDLVGAGRSPRRSSGRCRAASDSCWLSR